MNLWWLVSVLAAVMYVCLDGGYVATADLYRPHLTLRTLEKTGLALDTHTAAIEDSGEKNPASTGYYVDIDALEVVP